MTTSTETASDTDAPQNRAWGPVSTGGRRRGLTRRPLILGLILLVVLPAVYGAVVTGRLSSSIQRVEVAGLSAHAGGSLNILVTGSDSRDELTEEELLEIGTNNPGGERTDTIFILSIRGSRAAVLAFPRDLYVQRCDGTSGRINAALSSGGPECLVRTVEGVSGIPIHRYLAVSFGGFRDIVDAVGGVDICVDKPLHDPFAGISLDPGCQTLSGTQALGYVRTRKLDNDLERINRQQQFLGALARKLAVPATALWPPRALTVSGAVGRALTADAGMGMFDLMRLANGGRGLAGGKAITATVPVTFATIGGASVLRLQEEAAAPLFTSFRDGTIFEQIGAGVTRAEVRIRVLNGANTGGLAGATRDALRALGYDVVGIGDTEVTAVSSIRHPLDQRAAAELLARDLPIDVELVTSAGDGVITLVLGTDLAAGLSP